VSVRVVVKYICGCKKPLLTFEEAQAHVISTGHTLSIAGEIKKIQDQPTTLPPKFNATPVSVYHASADISSELFPEVTLEIDKLRSMFKK
jgi:hypothetical protein